MASSIGVFIHSKCSKGEIVKTCNLFLQSLKLGASIKFVKDDVKFGGIRMYFSDYAVVPHFLLNDFKEDLKCLPMTTTLIVHDALPESPEEFCESVKESLKSVGLVLKVTQIPISDEFPDIGTGNWKVLLDVPEFEELEVFRELGLPDEMTLQVPVGGETYRVSYHCAICKKDGHTQSLCPDKKEILNPESESTNPLLKSELFSVYNYEQPSKTISDTSSTDSKSSRNKKKASPKSPTKKKTARKTTVKNLKVVLEDIGRQEARKYARIDNKPNEKSDAEKMSNPSSPCIASYGTMENNQGEPCLKKVKLSPSIDDHRTLSNSTASSTTPDAGLMPSINKFQKEPSPDMNPVARPYGNSLFSHPSEDSSQVTTSNEPEPRKFRIKPEISYAEEYYDSQDYLHMMSDPIRRRKKPAQCIAVKIPQRIKDLMKSKETPLLVSDLEALFNHLKKKSNLLEIVRKYTDDVDGLKDQLKNLQKAYYSTAAIGSKEEKLFMKWFDGLMGRFEKIFEPGNAFQATPPRQPTPPRPMQTPGQGGFETTRASVHASQATPGQDGYTFHIPMENGQVYGAYE